MTNEPSQAEQEEVLILPDDGSRPHVDDPGDAAHRFCPWDEVMIVNPQTQVREGPYWIKEAIQGRYLLCDAQGNTVKDGNFFPEAQLVLHDPFA